MNLFVNFFKYSNFDFYNKDRKNLKKFLYKFKIKLRRNRDWFFEKLDEIIYFVKRFKRKVELRIFSLIQFIIVFIDIIKDFYKALKVVFENLDKKIVVFYYIQKLR